MTAGSWEDQLTDWEDDLDRPDGHPLVAMGLGVAVIIALSLVAYAAIPVDVMRYLAATLGVATLLAAAVWGACWFLTARFAAAVWQFVLGAVFWLTALVMVAFAIGGNAVSLRMDIATMQRIRLDRHGDPAVPRGSAAGPVTKRTMAFYREFLAQDHIRNVLYLKLGTDRFTQTWAVMNEPSLLTDCERFPRAAPQLAAINAKIVAAIGRFRGDVGTLVTEQALQKQVLVWVDQAFPTSGPRYDTQVAMAREQLDLAARMCGVLGRHHWRQENNGFGFTSDADYREYDALAARWDTVVRDLRANADLGNPDAPPVPEIGR
jgi:hypothetical protein